MKTDLAGRVLQVDRGASCSAHIFETVWWRRASTSPAITGRRCFGRRTTRKRQERTAAARLQIWSTREPHRCTRYCEQVFETVRYTYRLRPGASARVALEAEWHRCRFLWNEAVHQQQSDRRPTAKTLSVELTRARAASAWLRAGSSVVQQQVLREYAQALSHSFTVAGRRRPGFKARRRALPSLNYTKRGFNLREGRLC